MGFQSLQLGIARQNTRFDRLRFRAARVFHGDQHVVESDRKQVEKDPDGENRANLRRKLAPHGGHFFRAEERVGERCASLNPNEAE